jgi:phosphatidylinositol kinase/protein kinase (PI-3  family)
VHLAAAQVASSQDDPHAAFASSSVVSASRRHHPTLQVPVDKINEKAVSVMRRVHTKLTGRDFVPAFGVPGAPPPQPLDVGTQVDRLIEAATSKENLCQCYIGWCAFW